jgi:hypothetical protein
MITNVELGPVGNVVIVTRGTHKMRIIVSDEAAANRIFEHFRQCQNSQKN